MKRILKHLGFVKQPEDIALWYDRDSIHFKPKIKTEHPDRYLDFNATFRHIQKEHNKLWRERMTSDVAVIV